MASYGFLWIPGIHWWMLVGCVCARILHYIHMILGGFVEVVGFVGLAGLDVAFERRH